MVITKKQAVRRRRQVEQSERFLFEIKQVHSHYSFGDGSRLDRTAFSEHLHPGIDAVCLAPEKFTGRVTRFTIIGDRSNERDLWGQVRADEHHGGVGTLTFRGARSEYLGSLPFDALWNVMLTVAAGGFRYIYLHGGALKHGSSRIRWMALYEEFDDV